MIAAFGFTAWISFTQSSNFSSFAFWVRLRTMVVAFAIWLLKNSPNAFICLEAFIALTTVTNAFNFRTAQ